MRPATLLQRVLSDLIMRDRYYDVSRIQRGDRPIMEAICKQITSSSISGVYAPDPVSNGTASLLKRVTRWAASDGDEEGVAAGLERLSKYGFIEITDLGCILLPAVIKSQATSSAINGRTSPGRPRKGEGKLEYCMRAMAHREALLAEIPRLSAADKLRLGFGKQVTGMELARTLRATPSIDRMRDVEAPNSTNGRTHPETHPSPLTSTRDVIGRKVSTDAPTSPASVAPAQAPAEGAAVCAANRTDTGGEFTGPAGRLPFMPLAGLNLPVDTAWADHLAHEQTDNSEFATSVRTSVIETNQTTLVSLDLQSIANFAADRWHWSTRHRQEAPWIFQQCLDRGYTVEQLRLKVETSTKPCSSASFYNQFFPSLKVPAGPPPSARVGNR